VAHIIGVDTGNKSIKTINCHFAAGLKSFNNKPPLMNEWLLFNNKYYIPTNQRVTYLEDKTQTDEYFILTLFAISKEVKARNLEISKFEDVILSVGLPPSHIGRLGDEFIKYFKKGFVNYEYNGEKFSINLKNILLFPQAYSAIVPDFERYREIKKAYIIDIGGYTTDVILLNNGQPDLTFCESLDFGMIHLFNIIKRKIKLEYGNIPDEMQIDNTLETGEEIYGNMSKIIEEEAEIYIDELFRTLVEMGIDLKLSHSIFMGGGSLRLKRFIDKSSLIGKKYFIKNINANAVGYELLAKKIYKQGVA
jgi:plasmid segregation protein ParM